MFHIMYIVHKCADGGDAAWALLCLMLCFILSLFLLCTEFSLGSATFFFTRFRFRDFTLLQLMLQQQHSPRKSRAFHVQLKSLAPLFLSVSFWCIKSQAFSALVCFNGNGRMKRDHAERKERHGKTWYGFVPVYIDYSILILSSSFLATLPRLSMCASFYLFLRLPVLPLCSSPRTAIFLFLETSKVKLKTSVGEKWNWCFFQKSNIGNKAENREFILYDEPLNGKDNLQDHMITVELNIKCAFPLALKIPVSRSYWKNCISIANF